MKTNKNYGKLTSGAITYAPLNLVIDGTLHTNPTAAQYLAAGWKAVNAARSTDPAPSGSHYEPDGYTETDTAITRKWKNVADPVVPRKWSRLSIKTAIANKGWMAQMKTILGGISIATDYTAWEALTDCDYIEEYWPSAAQWSATLDAVATAIGKTRAEIDAFLDTVPTDPSAEVA